MPAQDRPHKELLLGRTSGDPLRANGHARVVKGGWVGGMAQLEALLAAST